MHQSFWNEIRVDYNRLSYLTCMVDRCISPLVMVSFIDNILFLCIQLYQSLNGQNNCSDVVRSVAI
ncbi:unnamed protein product [Brassicogethes aeneus]|uniref:Uncharacterized protein n=1 Tax=Brassicogethes aeneus TaxID=1431903 RepID=A0A9P0FI35_BRAAE|nr:unnamed protein product [Brassicogethes aeneus]